MSIPAPSRRPDPAADGQPSPAVRGIALLGPEECERHARGVLALRDHWIPRPRRPSAFHTLGVNGYMDLAGDARAQRRYAVSVASSNRRLRAHFGDLLEAVRASLGEHLGEPVSFEHPFALPGMHIWERRAIPRAGGASLHFDLQHEWLVWPPRLEPERSATVSFTLPLRLPARGGSLWTWDYTYEQFRAERRRRRLRDVARALAPAEHAYRAGTLAVHSGHVLHQIAPVSRVRPDDLRITLQGHGIRVAGVWRLYW